VTLGGVYLSVGGGLQMVEETEGASGVIFAYLVTAVGAHSHSTRQHSTAKYHNAQVPKQFVSDGMCNKRAWLKQHEKLGAPVQRAGTYRHVGRLWSPWWSHCKGVLYPERRSLHTSTKAEWPSVVFVSTPFGGFHGSGSCHATRVSSSTPCSAGAAIASVLLQPAVHRGVVSVSLGASGAIFGLFAVSVLTRLSWDPRKLLEGAILGQFVVGQVLNEARMQAVGGLKVGGLAVSWGCRLGSLGLGSDKQRPHAH
jgi:hypothetical protein